MKQNLKNHKHVWMVSSAVLILAVLVVILMPQNKNYSMIFIGIAGGHLIVPLIAIFTGWVLIPEKLLLKVWKRRTIEGYDFGWSPKWIYGFLVAAILVSLLAVHVYIAFDGSPVIQFSAYTLLLLLAVNFFIGNVIIRNSDRTARITLPMVNLLPTGSGNVLDAGCGAGRTTIALAQAMPAIKITSFDKFDAAYIDDGGVNLLKRNIKLAGIEERVTIETGDITRTSFDNDQFDAIVSSFMIDHLRTGKRQALQESFRILKPGGRFLLIIVVRGYTAFGIAIFFSLLITSRKTWKNWIEQTGFKMICDGKINEGAYFCFEKPFNSK